MESPPDFRDVHKIAQLFHQLHNTASPDALSKEARRILGATAPEDEFMAITTWSGRCSLIHKLPPDKYPPGADKIYKIPDLFTVFEYKGRSIPALVEVKSTYTPVRPGPLKVAKLGTFYRQRLQNYGRLLGLPILVAQQIRPGGIWFLVDLETIGADGKPNPIHDLSGLLLGTFHLTFRAGTKFIFRIEKQHVISDKEFTGIIREAHFETADGTKITKTHSPMMLLFGLGDPIDRQEDDGKILTMIFEIPNEMAFINYQALRAAIYLDKQLDKEQFPWAAMVKSGKFPISYSSVESAREDAQFFSFEISTRPKQAPGFLMP
ncbi:hypothetical protein ACFLV0_02080 [Chloroflexota bacterium]